MSIDWDDLVLGPVMGVFGQQVVYTLRGSSPITIPDAVFDEESADIVIGEDAQVSTQRKPILGIRTSALPREPQQSDIVTVTKTGVTYVVKDVIPDGHGHAKLVLMQAKT